MAEDLLVNDDGRVVGVDMTPDMPFSSANHDPASQAGLTRESSTSGSI